MGVLGVVTLVGVASLGDDTYTGSYDVVVEIDLDDLHGPDDLPTIKAGDTVEVRLIRRDGDDVEHISDTEGILGVIRRWWRTRTTPARTVTA